MPSVPTYHQLGCRVKSFEWSGDGNTMRLEWVLTFRDKTSGVMAGLQLCRLTSRAVPASPAAYVLFLVPCRRSRYPTEDREVKEVSGTGVTALSSRVGWAQGRTSTGATGGQLAVALELERGRRALTCTGALRLRGDTPG
jgi:hypothetical protein